jgi:predicted DCC family thiol-disulfide oxidoreductase YuxK
MVIYPSGVNSPKINKNEVMQKKIITTPCIPYPVILFDGFCNLCDRSVNLIIRKDPEKHFRFVALQSEAGVFLQTHWSIPPETDSVILCENGTLYFQSEAFLRIVQRLHFPGNLAITGWIIPRFLRDHLYRRIARHRFHWFGKRGYCRIPDKDERERFLSIDEIQKMIQF